MKRVSYVFLLALFLGGCGKNDGVAPIGYAPNGPYAPVQAPPPPNGYVPSGGGYGYGPGGGYGYGPSGGGYGPGAYGGGAPVFNPQMPPGMPPQYYPFLPIDNFFRQNPSRQQYWGQYWNGWVSYAGQQGYNPYDFTPFWNDYCANQWGGGQYANLYNYYNTNFYSWVGGNMQFQPNVSPSSFWQNYIGYSYAPIYADYSSCDSCCSGGCY